MSDRQNPGTLPFELLRLPNVVVARGKMPAAYVLPRRIVYQKETYVLLSEDVQPTPSPDVTHRYIQDSSDPYSGEAMAVSEEQKE